MYKEKLSGIFAPVVTPFDNDKVRLTQEIHPDALSEGKLAGGDVEGEILNISGSSELLTITLKRPSPSRKYNLRTHVVKDRWVVFVITVSGIALEWFRAQFCREMAKKAFYGEYLPGVLQNKPKAGQIAAVAYAGAVKVVAGAIVAVGVAIKSDSVGRAITADPTDFGQGVALEAAAAAGNIISVLLGKQGHQTAVTPVVEIVVATSGAIDLANDAVFFDTTAGVSTCSLADAAVDGKRVVFKMLVDGGDQVMTPANLLDGATITFDDVGDSCELVFDGTNWGVIGTPTATVA